ncbi:Ig-like domain-containing protein [Pseudoalteromonas haloplanktis]|uniref:Ig-like domain-containing protein n=1 Tax=Pseudoalteromonas haloplanktis TaxID=228 RepID=A0ABU1BAD1_PSEHA|nr:Ig-like domain-containing protein [Pseudoalteromonas haloplanktis]MDQ9091295.1 Ig-like domain-containing protein [Pseudoalteromonas haloplanktis]
MKQVNFTLLILSLTSILIGCGGGNSDDSTDLVIQPPLVLNANNTVSTFKQYSDGVVNLSGSVKVSDGQTGYELVDVAPLDDEQACTIKEKNSDNFVVASDAATACYFKYTVIDSNSGDAQSSAVSQISFQPSNENVSINKTRLTPLSVVISASECEDIDISANVPTGSQVSSELVTIGNGTASIDLDTNIIHFCVGSNIDAATQSDVYYSVVDTESEVVSLGSITVTVNGQGNISPEANNFSYYFDPAKMEVKVPTSDEVIIDVNDFVEDADLDPVQLIGVSAIGADVAINESDDLDNTEFSFTSSTAGTKYISYQVTDHYGGYGVGVIKVEVAAPYQDFFVDTGDVSTSYTLTAPMTLSQAQYLGVNYYDADNTGEYEMATFLTNQALAICEARGGTLATKTDFFDNSGLVYQPGYDIGTLMGWPDGRYVVDTKSDYTGDYIVWNTAGPYFDDVGLAQGNYFSCKNIVPTDFKIRDPHYIIAGTIKDLEATYTNSLGENQFYIGALEWTSSDPSILQIDERSGVAEGIDEGTVTITARSLDNRFKDSIEVDVITDILVFGMGSLDNQNDNGFNLAVEQTNRGYPVAANAILRSTDNFGANGTVKLKANWVFETARDGRFSELRAALAREYPPAVVQIGYPNQPDATTTNALRDFLYDGGVLMYFSQDKTPTNNIMRAVFGDQADAGTFTGAGGVFKFNNIDDPVINGPFGDLRNKYWGLDQSQVAYTYNLPDDSYVAFSQTYDESRGWDAGGSIKRTGITALRHKTLKFIWTGDAGFFGYHTNDPNYSETHTNAYPLMVADYNQNFADGDFRPADKLGYGSSTKFAVSNSTFFANAVTWLFGAAPSQTE